jgi:hypothetical protein
MTSAPEATTLLRAILAASIMLGPTMARAGDRGSEERASALDADVPAIARIARRRHALTSGTARSMAEAGLSVSLAAGSARANLTVNLAAARAEGADLDAALLAISQVLREDAATSAP